VTTRATYHHGDLRSTLINAALEQLEAGGESSVSLRALAKAAGVSPNAPYRHFEDKGALMAALAADGFRQFAEAIVRAGTAETPLKALTAQGQAYLDFAGAHPALYRLMFSPYGYSLHSPSCQNEATRAFSSLVATVARAQGSGWKTSVSLPTAALSYWSALHGWAGLLGDGLIPPEIPVPDGPQWLEAVIGFVDNGSFGAKKS